MATAVLDRSIRVGFEFTVISRRFGTRWSGGLYRVASEIKAAGHDVAAVLNDTETMVTRKVYGLPLATLAASEDQLEYEMALFDDDKSVRPFCGEFTNWVLDWLNSPVPKGWEKTIGFYAGNDEEALELFWKLVDEFRAARGDTESQHANLGSK